MKGVSGNLSANIGYGFFFKWTKLFAITTSAQTIIQLTGLLSGILIIRLLPTSEYALYTLANTMLGTMTVLADGGISAGVMSQGAKVWQDRQKLGVVIVTGFKVRKKFGVFSLLISMPILFYLLINHGASLLTAFLIILCIIPSFLAALSDNLLEISSKLHQGLGKLQKNQMLASVGRFVMITGALLVVPFTFVAVLGNGISRIWANIQLKKISADLADPLQKPDPIVEKEILFVVKRSLPGAIYYCISGQITIWLISIFGSTQSLAHVGALSRLTTILTIFTTLFSTLLIPRFARLKEDRKLLVRRFIHLQIALLCISLCVVGLVTAFPAQVLWILGKEYTNLKLEILLMAISSCMAMLTGVTYSVIVSRGWIIKPAIYISINILLQLILVLNVDLSKTSNVLLFSIVDFSASYIILIVYFVFKIYRLKTKVIL
ncbi:MAG TPA: polysaccharide biosynthesis protein [Mucilaginibacter sp.]|jgi:O-antigen/teichoic acid export membrane protein